MEQIAKRLPDREVPKGTLVSPRAEVLEDNVHYSNYNRRAVEEHGWIYTIDHLRIRDNDGDYYYECRSLATGELVRWVSYELEIADG